ncbi:MAG: alpha/beta fold hydrolase, partial [Pseudonocardiaceae bacterium]
MPELATQGAVINYEEAGEGSPLVLVHGSWDELETWRQVVPLLVDEFRLITFDRRGHGLSRGGGPLDADVDDLAALIEHVGPPVNVAASSLGAVIALRLATRRPDLFLT